MSSNMYVITYGDYSDYRIHSLWSSQEVAEKKLELLGRGYQIEVWPVDSSEAVDFHNRRFGLEVSYDFSQPGAEIRVENLLVEEALVSDWELGDVKFADSKAIVKSLDVESAYQALLKEFS